MRQLFLASAVLLAAAPLAAQKKSLLFSNRYDVITTEAGNALLNAIRAHDIAAVTPGAGATAFSLVSSAATSAMAGDADANGSAAQLAGVVPYSDLAVCGPFIKHADKANFSPNKIFWTVKNGKVKGSSVTVWSNGKPVVVRTGDFVRFLPNGQVEYFITQDQIMKAAGRQTGSWIKGATCLCQDKAGNLYYVAAHGVNAAGTGVGGGHWIEKGLPSGRQFCYDGGVVAIDAADITYDANGNVKDVKAASAKLVFNEITNPTNQPNLRDMCKNSGAKDDKGCTTDITFWMGGIDTDPNFVFDDKDAKTYFTDWNGKKRPHMIFSVVRSAFQSCGSWKATIFSTAPNSGSLGSIAKVNGVSMGSTTKADAAWMGLQDSKTLSSSPLLYGLQWADTNWNVKAPYGVSSMDSAKDGAFTVGTDKTIDLAVQGSTARFPVAALSFGVGFPKGGRLAGVNLSGVFGSHGIFYPPSAGWVVFAGGGSDIRGQAGYSFPLPNDNNLKGTMLVWQALTLKLGGKLDLTVPVLTELK